MQFNVCGTCGAKDGRAGVLVNGECLSCRDSRRTNSCVLHTDLPRTDEEIQRMIDSILGKGND